MKIKRKGLTLIELLVVISIIAMLLSIAIPNYSKWVLKSKVEESTKEIYSILNEARARAFMEKVNYSVCLTAPDKIQIKKEDNVINNLTLRVNFDKSISTGTNCFIFDSDGISNCTGNIHYELEIDGYSCVSVSQTRIQIGVWDGKNCNPK